MRRAFRCSVDSRRQWTKAVLISSCSLLFDLLFLNGVSTAQLRLIKRKERLQRLFREEISGLRYSEHVAGEGPAFRAQACKLGLEGAISKQADRPYAPGDGAIWVKSKCLNRAEFLVVGWTDPEGSRSHIGALLLGYYTDDGRLLYAGRAGTGYDGQGAEAPTRGAGAAKCGEDASRRTAAARQPVRLAAQAVARALGAAGCRR
jgi:ATP-dependent DNA ligase